MKKLFLYCVAILLCSLHAGSLLAADRPVAKVIEGEVLTMPGQSSSSMMLAQTSVSTVVDKLAVKDRDSMTEVIISGRNLDQNYNAFLNADGRSLVVDFWDASSSLGKDHFGYSTQLVNDIAVGDAGGRVRLVINMVQSLRGEYQVDASPNRLVVRLGNIASRGKVGSNIVENVDFSPQDRIAQLIVRTSSTSPVVNIREKDESLVLDVQDSTLAAGQERSLDVSEFPGPVRQVDSYQNKNNVRVVARLRDKVRVSSYQEGNVLTVSIVPRDLADANIRKRGDKDEYAFVGQKVTFDFKDIEIQNALKLISEISKLNIIMSDAVKGRLTMRLVDVPWDQAFDLILRSQGLGKEQEGNVVRVAPVSVLRKEYKERIEAKRGSDQLEPLLTEFIPLNFARVEDVKKMLEGAATNSTKGGTTTTNASGESTLSTAETSVGILSPRGSFLVDERTNTLILKDTEEAINAVLRLISTIDKPVQQVLIEGRIVEATDNFTRALGVSWGGEFTPTSSNRFLSIGPDSGIPVGGSNRGFLVDLPASTQAGKVGVTLGRLLGGVSLDLELSAGEANDEIKIVSNPRVITTNLTKATINQGFSVPFESTSQNGTSVQFREATLGLSVTPQITADNRVIMDVTITKDTPTTTAVGLNRNVVISTKSVTTQIFMGDGETVVIGGIYERTLTDSIASVPGLSKVPLFGWLFKNNTDRDDKTELLVFLTPTVLNKASESN